MASENHSNLQPGDPTTTIRPASTSDQGQPSSPKSVKPLVQDLPDELVQAGWSKCWSRRENRPYYFNKFTNQSLWEMPVFGQHDIIAALKMGQEVEMKSGLDGPEHQDKMVDGPATQNEKTFGRSVRPGGMD